MLKTQKFSICILFFIHLFVFADDSDNKYPLLKKIEGCWQSLSDASFLCVVKKGEKYFIETDSSQTPYEDLNIDYLPEESNLNFIVYNIQDFFDNSSNLVHSQLRINKEMPGEFEYGNLDEQNRFLIKSRYIKGFENLVHDAPYFRFPERLFMGNWRTSDGKFTVDIWYYSPGGFERYKNGYMLTFTDVKNNTWQREYINFEITNDNNWQVISKKSNIIVLAKSYKDDNTHETVKVLLVKVHSQNGKSDTYVMHKVN